jgi:hypothetical protein
MSLLIAFSNVFRRVYQRLSQIDMLLKEQYGFKSTSRELASFNVINEILLAMNNK